MGGGGEGGRRVLQCFVHASEQRGELGVLGFHLVDQGELAGPARHGGAKTGPQVGVLHAVVDEELGLEVLPAF